MRNSGVATREAMGVGFEDGQCLSSPTPGGSGPQFPQPGGLCASVSPPRGGSGPQFPHPGGLRASVSPPQEGSGPQFPHPTADAGWIRLGPAQDLIQQHRSGAVRGRGTHSHPPAFPGAVTGQGAPTDALPPDSCEAKAGCPRPTPRAPQSGLRDPLRTGASLRLLYMCPHPWLPPVSSPSRAPKNTKYRSGVCTRVSCVWAHGAGGGHA